MSDVLLVDPTRGWVIDVLAPLVRGVADRLKPQSITFTLSASDWALPAAKIARPRARRTRGRTVVLCSWVTLSTGCRVVRVGASESNGDWPFFGPGAGEWPAFNRLPITLWDEFSPAQIVADHMAIRELGPAEPAFGPRVKLLTQRAELIPVAADWLDERGHPSGRLRELLEMMAASRQV